MLIANEKRFAGIQKIVQNIDDLNDRQEQYTENDDTGLDDIIYNLTGKSPQVWEHKTNNRQQCYSTMYSKLFLAYLICEIKDGTLLSQTCLDQIADHKLETWNLFYYDDTGYQIADSLSELFIKVVEESSFFRHRDISFDFSVLEMDENSDIDSSVECSILMYRLITQSCPDIIKYSSINSTDLEIMSYYIFEDNFSLDIDIIESETIYSIYQAEKNCPTELGQRILHNVNSLFPNITHNWTFWCLDFTFLDHEKHTFVSYAFSIPDILGDDYYACADVQPIIHRYYYQTIFDFHRLNQYMKLYTDHILNKIPK